MDGSCVCNGCWICLDSDIEYLQPWMTSVQASLNPICPWILLSHTSVLFPSPSLFWFPYFPCDWGSERWSCYPLGRSPMKALTAVTLRITSRQTEPWSALDNEIETRRQVAEPVVINPLPVRVMCWFDKGIWVGGGGYAVAQLVEALRYKPEGRGLDFRYGRWYFSVT